MQECMQKNQLVTVEIEDMGAGGEGIGKVNGCALFIKDAIIGDVVEARIMKMKKNYGYAKLLNILTPSMARQNARCPEARRCGGCQIQEMAYEEQLAFKKAKVKNSLLRLGGVPEDLLDTVMEDIVGMEEPFRYRNKAQYPVGRDREGRLTAGFYAGRTHQIISLPEMDCALGAKENREILQVVLSFMEEYGIQPYDEETHSGLVRHILIRKGFRTGEIMVCLVINGAAIPNSSVLAERLCRIPGMTSVTYSINRERTNVIMGGDIRTVWGQDYITDLIGDIRYRISPLSFFQVNPVQTEKLYGAALEFAGLTGKETVWDLYCGIGTISLFLAQRAGRVYGVEIVPQAIEDAKKNATLNEITNASFYVGKAEEVLPDQYAKYGVSADVIVVDPPRKGCEQIVLETMVRMQPERIVYVSCDPATLGRDVKYLRENGYELTRVRPVDMFPQTVHVETVVLLSKLKSDKHIEVELEMGELDRN
ncbi:23S rRNA (uracil(1939)-C(5))-methyltransferase RlmD [Mordavella massiliensis]|nr:23S rRNA (uracil(1939)-C(5))-methyltransferase RlmD [Mordavella massiliensis]